MKYHIITFGCQANEADAERITANLEKKGNKKTSNINEAGLIVVNMCSVRQPAVDRVYGLAPKFKRLKATKKVKTVLTGCILKTDRPKFKKIFDEIWDNKKYFKSLLKYASTSATPVPSSAYIPISNGCNNFCSYCVVPYTRGPLVCRNHETILKEVKAATTNGVKEIWLLGQNVNDYQSPTDKSINFPKLLKLTSKTSGNFKIRFMSPHPKNFSDNLIEIMAESKKIAKYLNLPIQSGDNEILKRMNRPYTASQYKKLVKKLRKGMPDINLSTDVIVGFPGETKRQFENTLALFKEIGFNIAYISKYSPRPGTAACKIKDDVPLKEKKERERQLRDCLKK